MKDETIQIFYILGEDKKEGLEFFRSPLLNSYYHDVQKILAVRKI